MCGATKCQIQSRISEFVTDSRWENEEIFPYGAKIAGKEQNVLELRYKILMGSAIVLNTLHWKRLTPWMM
jgi:hypothetical protein